MCDNLHLQNSILHIVTSVHIYTSQHTGYKLMQELAISLTLMALTSPHQYSNTTATNGSNHYTIYQLVFQIIKPETLLL